MTALQLMRLNRVAVLNIERIGYNRFSVVNMVRRVWDASGAKLSAKCSFQGDV